jgi:hypothetical protein
MKNITYLFLTILLVCNYAIAQESNRQKAEKYLNSKGEVCFKFKANSIDQLKEIASFVSIGHKPIHKDELIIEAYANQKAFEKFLQYGLNYEVSKKDNELSFDPHKVNSTTQRATWDTTWDAYPKYSEYVAKMQYYASTYPNLCTLENIGTTQSGRDLLVLKITDNVSINEGEPEFFYTSTMHGDELVGFPLMIRLIDYLLTNYGTDSEVTDIVNSTEIYINPNANPDGSYRLGDTDIITNPRRANDSNQDLNRNYPDNVAGLHYDGVYEDETIAFMNFAKSKNFVLSANMHGGTELVNYPYDNAYASAYTHADTDYFEYISVEYATNAQNDSPAGYMTADDDSHYIVSPGVTHGAEWYRVYGGRQDYMNFYNGTKEVTLELSDTKWVSGANLPAHWNYNKQAFLDFMKQANYGLQGFVTDESGNPIVARIEIIGHDKLNTFRESEAGLGEYQKLLKGGTYNVTYSAPGYVSQTISTTIIDNATTIQNVTLVSTTTEPTASDVVINSGETAALSATGTGIINWYENEDDSSPVYTGANYTTPILTSDASYFVEDVISKSNVGSTNDSSNGGFFAGGASDRYLVFDCTEQVMLKKVTINAQQAGEIDIQLHDSSSNVLASRVVSVTSAGLQQIDLDFMVPVDNNLRLVSSDMSSGFSLYRNNSGVSYPYNNGSISIKDSNAGTGFYYFFYDWQIQEIKSSRKQVDVTVSHPLDIDDNVLSKVSIYPNPFKNSFDIQLPNNYNSENIQLTLYDISSRVISNSYNIISQGQLRINALDKLSIGTYFLKIYDANSGQNTVRKLIKE